ncbi:MAG: hypothetical protein A3I24_03545 [Candidatus Harrisonbacteria bacterium RIFCSPLOWO2_02_FULL_41_13b]|uniref:Uncharacterized protein n=1 Tax=Candidatus Harrisonbacteria bacterium RIFCSPLOWO2_02_FULL_41_13b TaxID=1798409 RepID=A0A1G1ZQ25_9BACT|nr:MAG: hypothetical protein A3I24_03545 [Candidatus Harrisonbacteria bacterium RIFCSPLOWO2_02_FULL_41_13b]
MAKKTVEMSNAEVASIILGAIVVSNASKGSFVGQMLLSDLRKELDGLGVRFDKEVELTNILNSLLNSGRIKIGSFYQDDTTSGLTVWLRANTEVF